MRATDTQDEDIHSILRPIITNRKSQITTRTWSLRYYNIFLSDLTASKFIHSLIIQYFPLITCYLLYYYWVLSESGVSAPAGGCSLTGPGWSPPPLTPESPSHLSGAGIIPSSHWSMRASPGLWLAVTPLTSHKPRISPLWCYSPTDFYSSYAGCSSIKNDKTRPTVQLCQAQVVGH